MDIFTRPHHYSNETEANEIVDDLLPDFMEDAEDEIIGINNDIAPTFIKKAEDSVWDSWSKLIDNIYPKA